MSGLKIEFEIEGEKQVSLALEDVEVKIVNFAPPLKKVRKYLLKIWQLNFQTNGKLLGKPWKKLKPATVKRKKGKGGILRDSGDMVRSFSGTVLKDSLVMKNSADQFAFHQSKQPRKSNLPRRIMMRINEQARQRILEIFNGYVNKIIPRNLKK